MNTEKKFNIIVVDDHPLVTLGIGRFLNEFYEFQVIAELLSARELINGSFKPAPDLILLDIEMKETSGFEAFRGIKEKFPKALVVAFTAHTGLEAEAKKRGFDGYIKKESDPADLVTAIEAVREGKKYFPKSLESRRLPEILNPKLVIAKLSKREREVMQWLLEGFSDKEIAGKLPISPKTIKKHRSHIYAKLGVHKESELILKYGSKFPDSLP